MSRMLLTHKSKLGVSDTDISHILAQVGYMRPSGAIASGEIRTAAGSLTAGLANAFAFYWQNTLPQSIIIVELMVDITTAGGTAGADLDAGSAASASTASSNLINDGDLNTVAVLVSTARVKLDPCGGTTDYVTGQILTQNASSLVGKWYITYMGV